MSVGGFEVFNTTRLQSYLTNVGSPFTTGSAICGCTTLTPQVLGETFPAYQTPALDPAPWYDPGHSVTGEYLGFLPLSITGVDDNPRARAVTNAVGGGGVFGPSRALPRTITVTGLVLGTTCCGADFGVHYLGEVLAGCTGDQCDGDCFEMYDCCPAAGLTPEQFNAAHRRTFRRTALVSGPTVIKRDGDGVCAGGTCSSGGDIITVEFVLVAATPWAWTDTTDLLNVALPMVGDSPCIDWCLRNPETGVGDCTASECLFGDCTDLHPDCPDPRNPVPVPPQPTIPPASFCVSVGSERNCYDIDLSTRPQWGTDVPVITLYAGSSELRNIRILLFEKPDGTLLTCDEIADIDRCTPQNEFVVTYLQAGGTIVIDGQTGRSTTDCNGVCRTSTTVYGDQDGGPVRINEMSCGSMCLCLESDPAYPPAADATITFSVSGRGY